MERENEEARSLARRTLGIVSIVAGVVWWIGFPKSGDWLRPDTVVSICLASALLGAGVLLLLPRMRPAVRTLSLALLVSTLGNAGLWVLYSDLAETSTRVFESMRHGEGVGEAAASRSTSAGVPPGDEGR